jgi:ankyrin repeat protein
VTQRLCSWLAKEVFIKIVVMLLQKDANATVRDGDRVSPIMAAAVNGHDGVIEMLLEKLDDVATGVKFDPTEASYRATFTVALRAFIYSPFNTGAARGRLAMCRSS